MTVAEMMAMPDLQSSEADIDNSETNSQSDQSTSNDPPPHQKKITQSIAPVTTHNININYHHSHSIEGKDGDTIDVPILLQKLQEVTTLQSPGQIIQTTQTIPPPVHPVPIPQISTRPREKTLNMGTRSITFTALDIPDPPHISFANDMRSLLNNWESTSYPGHIYIRIKGVGIPLKYWSQVYRWAKPEVWTTIKDHWNNWRVNSLPIFEKF
jgi:hypothetical protein